MAEEGLSQAIITDSVSIFYLTGKMIEPGERFLALYLNTNGAHRLVVNGLFAFPEDIGVTTLWYGDTEDGPALLSQCADRDKPLGIDKDMPARFLLRLMELGAASAYKNASACVDTVRARKDDAEAALMRKASRLNDSAMEAFKPYIKTGVTELELRDILLRIYKELGADGPSFAPLIGFGPNAAIGHHLPDGTALRDGDCVLIDVGCKKDGYCADMTRTYFKGRAPERMRAVYDTVKAAGDAARSLIKPGVRLSDVDGAARTVIENAGYGPYFTHRLGHFIGLDVHEAGDVSAASDIVAAPGMIFSIEPGIYLPGEGGVRIEDLVLVTAAGCEVLNAVPRDLTVL
ncbi:Xaa-Pro dipeptidase [Sporobacter termitidis DSM 10068]|uniref:Xaa-Pro dipeptidase n=2 Tax=Sporobacter TaxID=44748 RepID=A0A1M5Z297_9FIRM|nr:Xaa-Pro dipeptidase [Sporobacter termitidis DSM 10068]